MRVRAILRGGLFVALSLAAWGQTPAATPGACPPAGQEQASAAPPPAVTPVKPEEQGPQLPPPYQRLNTREKFHVFVQHTYSPYTFVGAAFDAGTAQAAGAWHSYGGGMEGYGKRFGASLADSESGVFFGRFLFPVLFKQDPRYIRSSSVKTFPRMAYALSRIVVAPNDSGKRTINLSLIMSAFASAGLANAYYPRPERGLSDTAGRAGGDLLSTAGMNLLREFWPDIIGKFRKHEPKPIQKIEQSPQVSKIEQMMLGPTSPPQCLPEQTKGTEEKHP